MRMKNTNTLGFPRQCDDTCDFYPIFATYECLEPLFPFLTKTPTLEIM
jgi:hypothetical protein